MVKLSFLIVILLVITSCSGNLPVSDLENGFINPPDHALYRGLPVLSQIFT